MNSITKKLLSEILSFTYTRKFKDDDIYVKKAYEKLGNDIVLHRLLDLKGWIDPVHHIKDTNLEKYVYYDDEFMTEDVIKEIYNEFILLFKYLPELKEVFVLKEKHIEFNPKLSKNDIKKMYQFVKDFYKENPRNATFYIPYEE